MEQSRGHLTRRKIAEAAILVLDQGGLEGLSMRKLGGRLGVEAMSLYNHVRNKADLLDAIHETLMEGMAGSLRAAQAGADWQATAQGMTRAFLTLLQSHPNAIPLFASRSAIAPGSLVMVDGAVGVLIQAGFTPDESIKIFQTLFALTIGHAMFHYGRRAEDSYARAEEYAKYPYLSQVGSPTLRDPEAEFEYGLAAVLEGLGGQLNRK